MSACAIRSQRGAPQCIARGANIEAVANKDYVAPTGCVATDFVRTDPEYDMGITGAMKIAHLAEAFGLDCELHACGPPGRDVGSSATATTTSSPSSAATARTRCRPSTLRLLRPAGLRREDRLEDALAFAGRALTLVRERGERGFEAWALRLLGEIAAHPQPPNVETAECRYRDALALATELGLRPLVAHRHLGLGRLYRCTGEEAKAREHLTTAAATYREMGMGWWLDQAEAGKSR